MSLIIRSGVVFILFSLYTSCNHQLFRLIEWIGLVCFGCCHWWLKSLLSLTCDSVLPLLSCELALSSLDLLGPFSIYTYVIFSLLPHPHSYFLSKFLFDLFFIISLVIDSTNLPGCLCCLFLDLFQLQIHFLRTTFITSWLPSTTSYFSSYLLSVFLNLGCFRILSPPQHPSITFFLSSITPHLVQIHDYNMFRF